MILKCYKNQKCDINASEFKSKIMGVCIVASFIYFFRVRQHAGKETVLFLYTVKELCCCFVII